MFKLDLEKGKEPDIKMPTSTGSLKNQESSRKHLVSALLTTYLILLSFFFFSFSFFTSALLTMPKPLTVWITTNWKILKEM